MTDDDYEQWRAVRLAVLPYERCSTVAQMRAAGTADRLMVLARIDGTVVGHGHRPAPCPGRSSGHAGPAHGPQQGRRRRVWLADPMFLAVHDGEVVGCAGMELDTDIPGRAENGNVAMRTLNERLGYATTRTSVSLARPLPLDVIGATRPPPPPRLA